MWTFVVGELFAKTLLAILPRRWSDRIKENTQEMQVFVLRTGKMRSKQRMTLIEGVFATVLFDLALFGTSNIFIKAIISLFTNLQNSWDKKVSGRKVLHLQRCLCWTHA